MPCGWVLLWLVLSHCPKAGCCHGLNSPHALWLGVTMALLSQCPKAGCCHRLNSPHALRLGALTWPEQSQCLAAGCYYGLCCPNALRLGAAMAATVPMPCGWVSLKGSIRILEWYHAAFLNQKLRQDCLKQLLAPPAVFESSALTCQSNFCVHQRPKTCHQPHWSCVFAKDGVTLKPVC